jgi:hypothetical protein
METLLPPDGSSARIIEAYCSFLDSPSLRLRFIRKAVARCQSERLDEPSKWPLFDSFRIRRAVVEELVPLLPSGATLPISVRVAFWAYRLRFPIYATAIAGLLAAVAAVLYAAVLYFPTFDGPATAVSAAPAAEVAPAIAEATAPYAPEHIWLVEQGVGYETYSNGARIITEFETESTPRRFFAFPRGAAGPETAVAHGGTPVGIVYHTSQSHIAPFAPEYNQKLKTSSRALLDYVRRNHLYNYVIDRFGRIYRIVPEQQRADHAGNSVWADDENLYVDLSDGFLGVCFEAQWSPEIEIAPDQLNEAQLFAGRMLTAVLRSKYQIADANCVTHALVSVSPSAKLIGFHTDWAHAFPFEALGLSDKYAVETPSIAEFGFDHDRQFDKTVGRIWPGITKAEARLGDEAARHEVETSALRHDLQERYRSFKAWLARNGASDAGAGG